MPVSVRFRSTWRRNGLSIVIASLFLLFMAAQSAVGVAQYNEERAEHGQPPVGLGEYLRTGHFLEATAENWESEFLQMAAYVLLTAWLFQQGSSESKKPGGKEAVDRDPRDCPQGLAEAPWPVRRGGWVLTLYENSLSWRFSLLFLVSFLLHADRRREQHNEELLAHGGEPIALPEYHETAQFWFESFQNWQSEFLSLVAMVVLSIYLRQRGSPESKPVDAPHSQTGSG